MSIGECIRSIRKNRGWTQEFLAQKSGVPQTTISKIERGSVSPLFEAVLRIANALGVSLDTLAGRSNLEIKKQNFDPDFFSLLESDSDLVKALRTPEIINLVKELSPLLSSESDLKQKMSALMQAVLKVLEKN